MKRFFVVSVLMVSIVSIGWRYAPGGMREKLLGFAGLANFSSWTDPLRDAVVPQDPVRRRQSAIHALKEKIGAIQGQVEAIESFGVSESDATFLEGIGKTASEAAELITRLEEANDEQSLGERVAARVIDAVLPPPSVSRCVETGS